MGFEMNRHMFFAALLFVAGCTPVIAVQSLSDLQLGMTRAEVLSLYGERSIVTLPIAVEGEKATVDVYYLQNGDYRSDYFLAYEPDGKLLFWGYPHEFARSTSPHINAVGAAAVPGWHKQRDRLEAERAAARAALD